MNKKIEIGKFEAGINWCSITNLFWMTYRDFDIQLIFTELVGALDSILSRAQSIFDKKLTPIRFGYDDLTFINCKIERYHEKQKTTAIELSGILLGIRLWLSWRK